MKRKGGLGFLPGFLAGSAESSAEMRFISSLDLRDKVVYDVGAYEGVLTLFFSRQAKHVVAYEPTPGSCERLVENVALNGLSNVTVRRVAVGDHRDSLCLTYDRLMRGAASGDPSLSQQVAETADNVQSATAALVPLDDDIAEAGLPAPDFVKVDIEGMELSALRGMRRTLLQHRPALHLEMHGAARDDKEERASRIVEYLWEQGYTDIVHIESGRSITPGTAYLAAEGHLYARPAPTSRPSGN